MKYLLWTMILIPGAAFASAPQDLSCKSYKESQFKITYSAKVDVDSAQLLSDITWRLESDGETNEGTYKVISFNLQNDKTFSLKAGAGDEGVSLDAIRRGRIGYQGWGSILKITGTGENSLFDFPVVCTIN